MFKEIGEMGQRHDAALMVIEDGFRVSEVVVSLARQSSRDG